MNWSMILFSKSALFDFSLNAFVVIIFLLAVITSGVLLDFAIFHDSFFSSLQWKLSLFRIVIDFLFGLALFFCVQVQK